MAYVLAIIIIVGIIGYVAWPLLRKPSHEIIPDFTEQDQLEQLEEEKHQAFENIRDLEFEYQMDKLSLEDYNLLRSAAISRGLSIIKASKTKKPISKPLEATPSKTAQDQPKIPSQTNYCPQCGTEVAHGDRFCRNCGKQL